MSFVRLQRGAWVLDYKPYMALFVLIYTSISQIYCIPRQQQLFRCSLSCVDSEFLVIQMITRAPKPELSVAIKTCSVQNHLHRDIAGFIVVRSRVLNLQQVLKVEGVRVYRRSM